MKSNNIPHKLMLVGKEVNVLNTRGVIVKETKHMLIVQTAHGEKKFPKCGQTFIIEGEHVLGEQLVGRHEDRLKV